MKEGGRVEWVREDSVIEEGGRDEERSEWERE